MMERRDILIVDDDRQVREVLHQIFLGANYKCLLANDGQEAIEMARRYMPQLIVLDVRMPKMGGFEATAAIRAREHATGAHLPIVAMTAHAMKGDRERCLEAGMDAYVAKPIQPAQLMETVEGLTASAPAHPVTRIDARGDQIVDEAALLARVDGDRRLLKTVIGLFWADAPEALERIRRAIADHDPRALQHAAHALKGSAANFAALPAVAGARELETMGREGRLEGAEQAYAALEAEIERLTEALVATADRDGDAGPRRRGVSHQKTRRKPVRGRARRRQR